MILKVFWKYASSNLKVKTGVADLLNNDGDLSGDRKEKVNILSDIFCSVFTIENTMNIPEMTPK